MPNQDAVRFGGRQDQQDPHPFFVVETAFAGQGLSYKKYKVRLLSGRWPDARTMVRVLGGHRYLGGFYEWETLDTATFYLNTD